MKITNKAILIALMWAILPLSLYFLQQCDYFPVKAILGISALISFIGIVVSSLMTLFEAYDDPEIVLTIPIPFANLLKSIEAKRDLNRAINDKYIAMAKLEGYEFDRAHEEVQVLEKQVEKLEA